MRRQKTKKPLLEGPETVFGIINFTFSAKPKAMYTKLRSMANNEKHNPSQSIDYRARCGVFEALVLSICCPGLFIWGSRLDQWIISNSNASPEADAFFLWVRNQSHFWTMAGLVAYLNVHSSLAWPDYAPFSAISIYYSTAQ